MDRGSRIKTRVVKFEYILMDTWSWKSMVYPICAQASLRKLVSRRRMPRSTSVLQDRYDHNAADISRHQPQVRHVRNQCDRLSEDPFHLRTFVTFLYIGRTCLSYYVLHDSLRSQQATDALINLSVTGSS